MANEMRLINAKFAQHIANVELNPDEAGIVQWVLSHTPTVDAKPVVHAEWMCVNEEANVWMCTGDNGCGGEMIILENTPIYNGFVFCLYCGADMRKE